MLSFLPIQDVNRVKALFEENGVAYNEQSAAFCAVENTGEVGICLLELAGMTVRVQSVLFAQDRPELAEGLIRAALNYAGMHGAYLASCAPGNWEGVAIATGFQNGPNGLNGEIPEILLGSCQKFGKK